MSLPRPEADIAGALPIVYTFLSALMPAFAWFGYLFYNYKKRGKEDNKGTFNQDTEKIEEYVEKYRKMTTDSNELNDTTLEVHGVFNGHAAPVTDNIV